MYSSSFGVTLVALTMITTVVILAVTNNVVLSLGMVGALSIVRFRTAIKEPLDIAFLFWSIAVGIVLAAGMIPLAVIGSVVIGLILLVPINKKTSYNPYIVVVQCEGYEAELQAKKYLDAQTRRCVVKSKSAQKSAVELNMEIRLKDDNTDFINVLADMDGVLSAVLVSYNGSMIHNYYLYEEDGQLSMIPWDYNLAFGTFQGQDAGDSVNDAIDDVLSDRPMQAWIFSDETYTRQYHELYSEFLNTVNAVQIINDAYTLIADDVEKDPTKFCTYEEFETGVQTLKTFCSLRQESVEGQLAGTIPSTSEGQNADSAALVNADNLNLSDMGTMNTGGGPDDFDWSGNGNDRDWPGENTQPSDVNSDPDGSGGMQPEQQVDNMEPQQDRLSENRQPPGDDSRENFSLPDNQASSSAQQPAIIILSISIFVLAAGLLAAFKFKG